MSADERDTIAILARRALFVASALGGCSAEHRDRTVVPVYVEGSSSAPASSASAAPESFSKLRSFDELAKQIPPLSVETTLAWPERDRVALAALDKQLQPLYEELRAAYEIVDTECSLLDARCEARWRAAITKLGEARKRAWPTCLGDSAATAFRQRIDQHASFVSMVVDRVIEELYRTASARGESEAAQQLARGAYPGPCLSCGLAPTVSIRREVAFDDGSTSLKGRAKDLAEIASMMDKVPKARVFVRGHADASEENAASLSRARAEAVAAALGKLGIGADRIVIVSFGATLPIVSQPDFIARNRRVDFEWVDPIP